MFQKKYGIVVGVDFGTTFSGWAFSPDRKSGISYPAAWPDQAVPYCKTATLLLYDKNDTSTPKFWGNTARVRFNEQFEDETNQKVDKVLFQNFKMGLKSNSEYQTDINEICSKKTLDLITDYLRELWKNIKTQIENSVKFTISNSSISWCLSMPAMWDDKMKDQMKQAAYHAGMLDSPYPAPEHYLCVLEPEAAAVDCLKSMSATLTPGKKFLICDCGGGTVDVTCYNIDPQRRLKELQKGDGNDFGSTRLEGYFERFLLQKFGQNFVADIKRCCGAWTKLMEAWEKTKVGIKDFSKVKVPCPTFLTPKFKSIVEQNPELEKFYDEDFNNLRIPESEIKGIFQDVFNNVISLLKQFTDQTNFDYLFIVGGFAQSAVLVKAIKDAFASKVTEIFVPDQPGASVLKGCIELGKEPTIIKARKMRRSYGLRTYIPWNSSYPQDKQVILDNNQMYAQDGFEIYAKKDEEIEVDQVATRTFKLTSPQQKLAALSLYCSNLDANKTRFTTDNGVAYLARLEIDVSNTCGIPNRTITVQMRFGHSELRIDTTDNSTQKKYEMKVNYEDNPATKQEPMLSGGGKSTKYHFIFVNDSSGSMSGNYSNLLAAIKGFISTRTSQSKYDVVSSITFDNSASIDFERSQISNYLSFGAFRDGGTSFRPAVQLVEEILNRSDNSNYKPIVYFMSDGESSDDGCASAIWSMSQRIPSLVFNAVGFGNSNFEVIKNFAANGRGQYFSALTTQDLQATYANFNIILEN